MTAIQIEILLLRARVLVALVRADLRRAVAALRVARAAATPAAETDRRATPIEILATAAGTTTAATE
jgi:hypothetical protein